jgi:hypothetical protein
MWACKRMILYLKIKSQFKGGELKLSVVVTNAGVWERTASGQRDTKKLGPQGEVGTVTVTVRGRNWVFGPGQSITFADNGEAAEAVAADGRLRIADTREGFKTTGRS